MDKALRFDCLVRAEIVCPSKTNRLIPQFYLYLVGTVAAYGHLIPDPARAPCERWIVPRFAHHADIMLRGGLVEAGRQNAVVFQVIDCAEQTRGDVPLLIAQNRLEDLHLTGTRDDLMMGLEPERVCIVHVADDGPIGIQMARLKHHISV